MSEPTTASASLWDTFEHTPSLRQRVFMRYLTATLVDLVVLGLFAEYWEYVTADSFTIILLAAVLLQILLKLTIVLEHWVAAFFNARPGGFNKFMRFFGAWVVLFGSKFVILEAIVLAFGDRLRFGGPFHGVVALIVVVVTMLVVEAAIVMFYRRMG
jgi:hypothetical protein